MGIQAWRSVLLRLQLERIGTLLLLAIFISQLTACSATGPRFDIAKAAALSATRSQLYVFRESAFQESGTYPLVLLDGREIGELRNGGYLAVELEPGVHQLVIRSGGLLRGQWAHSPKDMDLVTKSGKRHYVQVSIQAVGGGTWIYSPRPIFIDVPESDVAVTEIPEETAVTKLKNVKLSTP